MNSHYDIGGIETIAFIKAKLSEEGYRGYLLGNVIKYTSRAQYKGCEMSDYTKAAEYVKWLQELEVEIEAQGDFPF